MNLRRVWSVLAVGILLLVIPTFPADAVGWDGAKRRELLARGR